MMRNRQSDLGLGRKDPSQQARTLNKDGSFNIHKENVNFWEKVNFYHTLITMSWVKFLGATLLFYILVNLFFASLYLLAGIHHLTSVESGTFLDHLLEAFFFSTQTFTTVGYGRVSPEGVLVNIISSIESFTGLLGFALVTGLVYGRFSKPHAKIRYSKNALISPYRRMNALMFRVVNPLANQLLEVEVTVSLSMKREGTDLRDFFLLELERSSVSFFPSMWTVVHPIGKGSPLVQFDCLDEIISKDVEIIVLLKAFDESFSQVVYSRSSYQAQEILWGHRFVYASQRGPIGVVVDVGKINLTEEAALNLSIP